MNPLIIISYGFFNKIMSLADGLEKDSLQIIDLIGELKVYDEYEASCLRDSMDALYSISVRAIKIKQGLNNAVVCQQDILNNNAAFKNQLHELSEDFFKIRKIWNDINEPNYYIDTDGKLIK